MRVIIQTAVLKATVNATMITCNSANDGSINITAPSGGSGGYQYTINGGTTWGASGSFINLAPGSYDIRIRDAANILCEILLNPGLTITEPAALSGMVIKTDITCLTNTNILRKLSTWQKLTQRKLLESTSERPTPWSQSWKVGSRLYW
jgi:hypothetical protein